MNSETPIFERFKNCFKTLHDTDLDQLQTIYADNVVFKDPVHEIRGLVGLEDYYLSLCAELTDCRFEYLDELKNESSGYIKWLMHFKHPKLGNRLTSVRGVSHLKIGEKIEYHEDFYDMGAMLYEQLPVLGNITRRLRLRLASGGSRK